MMVRRSLAASTRTFGPCTHKKPDGQICGTVLENKSKYERHLETHDPPKYECIFCNKKLKRPDVLNAHRKICTQRGDQPIPGPLDRGRKRHACNECSRLKVKCDDGMPCAACAENGRNCVKPGYSGSASPSPSTPADGNRNSINFLLNSPGEKDFMREFPKTIAMTPDQHHAQLSALVANPYAYPPLETTSAVSEFNQSTSPQMSFDGMLKGMCFDTTFHKQTAWQLPMDSAVPWVGSDDLNRQKLEQKAFEIREGLKHTAQNHRIIPTSTTSPVEFMEAVDFITADSIINCITLYFEHWHKHAPIIHEASFNPGTSALPLVLALMCLGGMYQKDREGVGKLKCLLDTLETLIFNLPNSGLNLEYDCPGREYVRHGLDAPEEWQQYQLEETQGGYLFVVLQYWTGNPTARARARQQRFPRVVQLFRHLELLTTQHTQDEVVRDEFTFQRWIRKESAIRLATIATMLDNTFGIFNNVAPRLQWAEIDLRFPSEEVYFKATSFEDYASKQLYPQPALRIKLKEAFMLLFAPQVGGPEFVALRNAALTPIDMQVLIYFLYTHLWTTTFNSPVLLLPGHSLASLTVSFKGALTNWRALWDEIRYSTPDWDNSKFENSAEGYYNAIDAIIHAFEKTNGDFPPIPSGCEKGMHLKILLGLG